MTIASTATTQQYIRNGTTTQWSYPNKIFAATDLTVIDLDTSVPPNVVTLILGTDYTVSNVDVDTGALVTTTIAGTAGHTLDIRSNISQTQSTSIKNQGSFLPELHEEFFDRITREVQDLTRKAYTYGIHGPDTEVALWPALPAAVTRRNTALMFDAITGLPAIGVPNTQIITTGLLAPFLNLQQSAAEIAAGVTPVNLFYAPGIVDRYGTNTTPGTTNMGPAQNAAIAQMLKGGAPVRFLAGAYSIATAPSFGGASTLMQPIDIGGAGILTQLINNCAASTALYDMNGLNGWYIHDLLITGNSVNKNDGIHCGHTGGAEQILWRVDRVTALMAGVGFLIADTNGGVLNQCRSWPNNPPVFPVPQTVNPSDVGHHFYLTGGFVNNVSLYDCLGLPSHNFFGSTNLQRALKLDCSSSFGLSIIGGDFETYQGGAPFETSIDINPSGSIQALLLTGVYYEGTTITISNMLNSNIGPLADGNVANTSFILGAACRNNTLTGVTAATINDSSALNYGNTFIACNARTTWTDNSTGPGDRRIACLAAGTLVLDWGGESNVVLAYSAAITANLFQGKKFRIVATNGVAFSIAVTNPTDGHEFDLCILNTSGGALGAITWPANFRMAAWTSPATGFSRSIKFVYDSVNWIERSRTTVDVPN